MKQKVISLDLEGVLLPEAWKLVAKHTGVEELNLTTRDIADYNELMKIRIKALDSHNITIDNIQEIISKLEPLEGALDFYETLTKKVEVIIISDTFIEFFNPIRSKLLNPVIFCNSLLIDEHTRKIREHCMRIPNKNVKEETVKALQHINCKVASAGDSYNDLKMLQAADYGAWIHAPDHIVKEHPEFNSFTNYNELAQALLVALDKL